MPDRHVQNISKEIFALMSDEITTDFEINKLVLNEITDIKSKTMRNKIAGRLVVMKKNEKRIISAPKRTEDPNKRRRSRKK